jgi:hypothetical protein
LALIPRGRRGAALFGRIVRGEQVEVGRVLRVAATEDVDLPVLYAEIPGGPANLGGRTAAQPAVEPGSYR